MITRQDLQRQYEAMIAGVMRKLQVDRETAIQVYGRIKHFGVEESGVVVDFYGKLLKLERLEWRNHEQTSMS
jgi:hypothetical protein